MRVAGGVAVTWCAEARATGWRAGDNETGVTSGLKERRLDGTQTLVLASGTVLSVASLGLGSAAQRWPARAR